MSHTLTIRPEAELDISEAYGYYQGCRAGLELDFVLCVEEAFDRVARNPLQYQVVHKNIRRAMTHRFPFGIFYVVVGPRIIVIAVMSTVQNPSRWQGRA